MSKIQITYFFNLYDLDIKSLRSAVENETIHNIMSRGFIHGHKNFTFSKISFEEFRYTQTEDEGYYFDFVSESIFRYWQNWLLEIEYLELDSIEKQIFKILLHPKINECISLTVHFAPVWVTPRLGITPNAMFIIIVF